MSITTKVSMDLAPLLAKEIGKYEEIILSHVTKTLNNLNIEEMIEKITESILCSKINTQIHMEISNNFNVKEVISEKLLLSIQDLDIDSLIKNVGAEIIEDALQSKLLNY